VTIGIGSCVNAMFVALLISLYVRMV